MRVHEEARGGESLLQLFSAFCGVEAVSRWAWGLPVWLDWLASKLWEFTCLCLPSTGLRGTVCHIWIFTWVLGIGHTSSCLWVSTNQLNYPLAPSSPFLKAPLKEVVPTISTRNIQFSYKKTNSSVLNDSANSVLLEKRLFRVVIYSFY